MEDEAPYGLITIPLLLIAVGVVVVVAVVLVAWLVGAGTTVLASVIGVVAILWWDRRRGARDHQHADQPKPAPPPRPQLPRER